MKRTLLTCLLALLLALIPCLPATAETQPAGNGNVILPDFSVTCIDGSTFTLPRR